MIFGKRERSRTERTAALSFDEPKGKAHNQWRLMLMFSAGWVPPLPITPTLSKLGVVVMCGDGAVMIYEIIFFS